MLPAPFDDDGGGTAVNKRPHAAVAGRAAAPLPSHPPKWPALGGPSPAAGASAAMLLPPQLRGRANVSVEDNEKIHGVAVARKMRRREQQEQERGGGGGGGR
jgi:hypothetical protein